MITWRTSHGHVASIGYLWLLLVGADGERSVTSRRPLIFAVVLAQASNCRKRPTLACVLEPRRAATTRRTRATYRYFLVYLLPGSSATFQANFKGANDYEAENCRISSMSQIISIIFHANFNDMSDYEAEKWERQRWKRTNATDPAKGVQYKASTSAARSGRQKAPLAPCSTRKAVPPSSTWVSMTLCHRSLLWHEQLQPA